MARREALCLRSIVDSYLNLATPILKRMKGCSFGSGELARLGFKV